MKRTFLQIGLFSVFLFCALPLVAQITINSDYPRFTDFTDNIYRTTVGAPVDLPAEGADVLWDYSGLINYFDDIFIMDYSDASEDSDFPGARNVRESNLFFQAFLIEIDLYEGFDSHGFYEKGRKIKPATYSIAGTTGGANDELHFPALNDVFEGRIDILKFPTTYGDEWTESHIEHVNYELTVGAFGLNAVPGTRKRTVTHTREVTGYGKLIIPGTDGSALDPIDVLLIKVSRSVIDSIFLAGQEPPAPLMAAFGLTQGATASDEYYVFYNHEYGGRILNINPGPNGRAFYHPHAADFITSIQKLNVSEASAFPNPIAPGQAMQINLDIPIAAGSISVFNISGRMLLNSPVEAATGNSLSLAIPSDMPSGYYVYQLFNEENQPYAMGKVMVVMP